MIARRVRKTSPRLSSTHSHHWRAVRSDAFATTQQHLAPPRVDRREIVLRAREPRLGLGDLYFGDHEITRARTYDTLLFTPTVRRQTRPPAHHGARGAHQTTALPARQAWMPSQARMRLAIPFPCTFHVHGMYIPCTCTFHVHSMCIYIPYVPCCT